MAQNLLIQYQVVLNKTPFNIFYPVFQLLILAFKFQDFCMAFYNFTLIPSNFSLDFRSKICLADNPKNYGPKKYTAVLHHNV